MYFRSTLEGRNVRLRKSQAPQSPVKRQTFKEVFLPVRSSPVELESITNCGRIRMSLTLKMLGTLMLILQILRRSWSRDSGSKSQWTEKSVDTLPECTDSWSLHSLVNSGSDCQLPAKLRSGLAKRRTRRMLKSTCFATLMTRSMAVSDEIIRFNWSKASITSWESSIIKSSSPTLPSLLSTNCA